MTQIENALGGESQGTGATRAATSIASSIIPPPNLNPTAAEINEMRRNIACLDDRFLVVWALRLRNATPSSSPRTYLLQQLLRCEIRRRRRNGGVR